MGQGRITAFVERAPLTYKVTALVLLFASLLWAGVDRMLTRDLEALFLRTLGEELEAKAARNRHTFDQLVQAHHRSLQLITSHLRFTEYLADFNRRSADRLTVHDRPPVWMPGAAALRSFFTARYAILLDARGEAREVYRHLPTAVPDELLRPSVLLQKLSHNQSYMTELEGQPYVLAAQPLMVERRLQGTLLLASPIDEEFLHQIRTATGQDTLVALLGGSPHRVLASSDHDRLPSGMGLDQVERKFLIAGKSFFDYGASDLNIQFASLLPVSRVAATVESVLAEEQRKRTWLTAMLMLPLLVLTWWIAQRIRRLMGEANAICRETLGHVIDPLPGGDEVSALNRWLHAFSVEIRSVRGALRAEAEGRLASERAAMMAERQLRDLEQLRTVTEALGIGVLLDGRDGPTAANRLMEQFADTYGMAPFIACADDAPERLRLRGADGTGRVFRLHRLRPDDRTLLVEDVTREAELERERRLFTRLPADSPNPILRIGASGRIEYANEASRDLLEACHCRVGDPLPDAIYTQVEHAIAEQQKHAIEFPVGSRTFAFFVTHLEESDFVYLHGNDITERKSAEAALVASEARFRGLLEAAPDAILMVDEDGKVLYANSMTQVLFGYAPPDLQGRPVHELIQPQTGEPGSDARDTLAVVPGHEQRLVGVHREGLLFPVDISLSPISGPAAAAIAIVRDVTERERDAHKIRDLNRQLKGHVNELMAVNQELEAFSYSVSHDLRGPLRTIDGFTQIILDDHGDCLDSDVRAHLDRIGGSARRMNELIDGLLRLSRVSRTELHCQPLDLSRVAEEVLDFLRAADTEREVTTVVAPDLGAEGDPDLLKVVLENLLGNAWKFTSGTPEAWIEFGRCVTRNQTAFFVRDNGAGFDMRNAERLFVAFERLHTQREFPGSGIGLATVARIVRRHGGAIWADAEPGAGATFYFTLPEVSRRPE